MKKTLIILVLFFSSSVFAEDDLTGKSIICNEINKNREPNVVGWDFISNQNVNHYFFSNADDRFKLANDTFNRDNKYKTTYSKIKIDWTDFGSYYEIERDTLNVKWKSDTSDILQYSGKNCSLFINEPILDNLNKILKKTIKEITKDNKL